MQVVCCDFSANSLLMTLFVFIQNQLIIIISHLISHLLNAIRVFIFISSLLYTLPLCLHLCALFPVSTSTAQSSPFIVNLPLSSALSTSLPCHVVLRISYLCCTIRQLSLSCFHSLPLLITTNISRTLFTV